MKPYIAIPAILAIVYRAWSRNSLTPVGLLTATLTATIHALHPWSTPFALLGVFFLVGTAATKVKHDVKARLTLNASGSSEGEGPRTHIQVLANSACATALILLDTYRLSRHENEAECLARGGDVLIVGIVANYAAVTADTLSSELGILSQSEPRLITTGRSVPRGTNGGVTLAGLLAGALGGFVIAVTSVVLLPFCAASRRGLIGGWSVGDKVMWVLAITVWGLLGSVLDSLLGAILQASVVDKRTGKVVEGEGGSKVLTSRKTDFGAVGTERVKEKGNESRYVGSGQDLLDNNQINFLMATIMSVGGMVIASIIWKVPLSNTLP